MTENQWIEVRKQQVYVGPQSQQRVLSPGRAKADQKKWVTFKTKNGDTKTRAVYDKRWANRATDAKFARVARLLKQHEYVRLVLLGELNRTGRWTKTRLVALALLIIHETGMRPSSEDGGETAGEPTYGCLSLRANHITATATRKALDSVVGFAFVGKRGIDYRTSVREPATVRGIRSLLEKKLPDRLLFALEGEDRITPVDLIRRMRKFNLHYKTKDLRTSRAMICASTFLQEKASQWTSELEATQKKGGRKKLSKQIKLEISTRVSDQLNNEPSTSKTKYINPEFWKEAFLVIGFDEAEAEEFKK